VTTLGNTIDAVNAMSGASSTLLSAGTAMTNSFAIARKSDGTLLVVDSSIRKLLSFAPGTSAPTTL
jgi:hypothetical protein